MYEIFEVGMLLCFAFSWPFNIIKSYRSRTAAGKSIMFEAVVLMGYFLGMTGKILSGNINYVLSFYLIDVLLVAVDMALYFRNRRLDEQRARACRCEQ